MVEGISPRLRREVVNCAGGRCEYCLMPEWALLAGCEVDHVISRKHGGITDLSNLALSCARCNRAKGTDVGSVGPGTGSFTRFFNPRIERWEQHFAFEHGRILGLTEVGLVTAKLLRLNEDDRVEERHLLQQLGEYAGASR
ncbi:MAG: HNH endonuclease [Limisphaerales bacterium]